MKKLLGIALLLCIYNVVRSQVVIALLFGEKLNKGKMEFGIVVIPALTNITNVEGETKFGLNLGIYFNFRPDKKLFFHVEGIAKGSFGAKDIPPYPTGDDTLDYQFAEGTVERKIQAFSLPVFARYKLTPKLFLEAGLQANMRLKSKDVFSARIHDNDLDYTVDIKDRLTTLDFGVAGGLFYKFRDDKRSMGMGLRYFGGLTDTHKDIKGNQVNTAWQLVITIAIGAGKAEETKTK